MEKNMREIKFRAWVKQGGRFREGMHDWQSMTDTIELESGFEKSLLRFGTDPEYMDRVILMQYTGLHDRNGVEIYEGDLVKLTDGNHLERLTVVKWNDSKAEFRFMGRDVRGHYHKMVERLPRFREVIGNIYESPELLQAA